jgi:hypothetical protein
MCVFVEEDKEETFEIRKGNLDEIEGAMLLKFGTLQHAEFHCCA